MTGGRDGRPLAFGLGSDGPSTILVGVDGSDASWRALHYAVGLARRQASRIVAVYATHIAAMTYAVANVVICAPADLDSQLAFEVEALGREHNVPISFVTADSDPVTAIAAVADELHADLIVVGASDKATHRLLGSVAIRTIKARTFRARCCPVTVVP